MWVWPVLGASALALGALLVLAWRHRATGRSNVGDGATRGLLPLLSIGFFAALGVGIAIAAGYVDLPPGLSEEHREYIEYLNNSRYSLPPDYDELSRYRVYRPYDGCIVGQIESFADAMDKAEVVFSGTVQPFGRSFDDRVAIVPDATWKGPVAPEYVLYDGTNMGPMWITTERSSTIYRGVYSWDEGEQYLVYAVLYDLDEPRLINYLIVRWESRTNTLACAGYDLMRLRLLWSPWRWPFLVSSMLMLAAMVALAWRHRARGPVIGH